MEVTLSSFTISSLTSPYAFIYLGVVVPKWKFGFSLLKDVSTEVFKAHGE